MQMSKSIHCQSNNPRDGREYAQSSSYDRTLRDTSPEPERRRVRHRVQP